LEKIFGARREACFDVKSFYNNASTALLVIAVKSTQIPAVPSVSLLTNKSGISFAPNLRTLRWMFLGAKWPMTDRHSEETMNEFDQTWSQ
jgi:hypothetical protein